MIVSFKIFESNIDYSEIINESLNPENDYKKVQKYNKIRQIEWCHMLWG